MTETTTFLDRESLTRLSALVGAEWRFFAGPNVSDWLTDVSIAVVTDGPALTISGEVVDLDFEGEDDTYSSFKIDDGASELGLAERAGHVYHFLAGQEVREVVVVRETVTERRNNQQTWSYVANIGIVFVLSAGAIAISKVSHHSELLAVTRADSLDAVVIDDLTSGWEDQLGLDYTFERERIPIERLLGT